MWGKRRTRAAADGRCLPSVDVIPHAFGQGRQHAAADGSRDANALADKGAVAWAALSGSGKTRASAGIHSPSPCTYTHSANDGADRGMAGNYLAAAKRH